MKKYLIVNSDDFGISDKVSQGIIEAHQKGIVTSTSVMVNMPAAAKAIQDAHEFAPNLGLGLHFVLSYGKPVSDANKVPSLVLEDGNFVSNFSGLMAKINSFTAEDLQTELHAQFERFVELAGHNPDHLDSHHGASYFHPVAWDIMLDLAEKHQLPIRRPDWLDRQAFSDLPTNTDGKLLEQLEASYLKHGKPKVPDFITDGTFFWDRRSRLEPLQAAIKSIQTGYTELICHVGYGAGLEEDYHIQREDELVAITNPAIVTLVKNNPDFQLINFADLPK